jgi:hypothetical protein
MKHNHLQSNEEIKHVALLNKKRKLTTPDFGVFLLDVSRGSPFALAILTRKELNDSSKEFTICISK